MHIHWHVQRTFVPQHDGLRRWDDAYQLLLRWAIDQEAHSQVASLALQEDDDEDCRVCPRLNSASAADAND